VLEELAAFILYSEDGGCKFLKNNDKIVPDYVVAPL
jgi:hypothetical protein